MTPVLRQVDQRLANLVVRNVFEGFGREGGDEQGTRLGKRNAARAQIEDEVLVQIAGGRAVSADYVVGIDFELRLGVELGSRRKQQSVARLLAIGLLGVPPDHHLALEHAAGLVVHDALEHFAAQAIRNAVIDDETGVTMLPAAQQIGPGELRIGVLAVESYKALLTSGGGAPRHRAVAQDRMPIKPYPEIGEMTGGSRLELKLDTVKPRARADEGLS